MNRRERRAARATGAGPSDPQGAALLNAALTALNAGRPAEALAVAERAAARLPDFAPAQSILGHARRLTGDMVAARAAFAAAARLGPKDAELQLNLGHAESALGNAAAAMAAYRLAVALNPSLAAGWTGLAQILRAERRHDEARNAALQALNLAPSDPIALDSLAAIDQAGGRFDLAEAGYRAALAVEPRSAENLFNLGTLMMVQGRTEDEIDWYRKALELRPDYSRARYNLGVALLRSERYAEGWPLYALRFHPGAAGYARRPFAQPAWDGKPLAAGRLLVWGEQGIGDELLWGSLLPELAERVPKPVVECAPRLVPLFRRALPEIEFVAASDPPDARLLAADIAAQAALGDLGAMLRPDAAGFRPRAGHIAADPARVAELRARYGGDRGRPLIGISWRSVNKQLGGAKSAPLSEWGPILKAREAIWIDLQYGDTAADRAALRDQHGIELIHDPEIDALSDMDGFAAQVAALDRVISVSNTTVHVAAALAKPCWVLLDAGALWYWFKRRADSPWYRSVRLFRQAQAGDWAPVMAQLGAELAAEG